MPTGKRRTALSSCPHGNHPGWCLDCLEHGSGSEIEVLRLENRILRDRDRRSQGQFEYLARQLGNLLENLTSVEKAAKDMQDPIRRTGPGMPGLRTERFTDADAEKGLRDKSGEARMGVREVPKEGD